MLDRKSNLTHEQLVDALEMELLRFEKKKLPNRIFVTDSLYFLNVFLLKIWHKNERRGPANMHCHLDSQVRRD